MQKLTKINSVALAQKETFITDTTVFKLVVWFNAKACGTPYTISDKQLNRNRKYIESYDWIFTKDNKKITNHELALDKLRLFYRENKENIINSILFYNDFEQRKQFLIGKFYKNSARNIYVPPIFTECNDTGQVRVEKLASIAIDKFQLIQKRIDFTRCTESYILLK